MSNLLSLEDAASILGVGLNNLYVQSANRPIWYVKHLGIPYVNMKLFLRQRVLTNKCYEANTSYLYWMMKELFKTDTSLGLWLSKRSSIYKASASWSTFINTMFAIPLENGVELRRTMQSEFFKISYITIKLALEKGVEFEDVYIS